MILLAIPFGYLTRVLHWCTDHVMTAALETMDLTSAQAHVMGFLSRQQAPPCPRDVEEALHLSHPTVSGILSRLEQKGFIALQPDPEDRRCKRIRILPRGQQCHQTMHQIIRCNEERMVQDFTPEEKEQFSRLLQRAITNMGGGPCHLSPKEESKQ